MRWPGNGGGTVRNARKRSSRAGATVALMLAIVPPVRAAVAQPTLASRGLNSAERPSGMAALGANCIEWEGRHVTPLLRSECWWALPGATGRVAPQSVDPIAASDPSLQQPWSEWVVQRTPK